MVLFCPKRTSCGHPKTNRRQSPQCAEIHRPRHRRRQKEIPDAENCQFSDFSRAYAAARAFIEHPERFNLLTVYEMRPHRKAQADLKQLREIQSERRAGEASRQTVAKVNLTARRDQPAAPAFVMQPAETSGPNLENGFDFSNLPLPSPLAHSPARDFPHPARRNLKPEN
jgi:hypothetical protein